MDKKKKNKNNRDEEGFLSSSTSSLGSSSSSCDDSVYLERDEGEIAIPLRSCDADLKVVVGQPPQKETFWYPTAILAMYSNYIDTLLSTNVGCNYNSNGKKKRKNKIREITFPDLSPQDWKDMIYFLQPLHCRDCTIQDALRLAPCYDKYDFAAGRQLCDDRLLELFNYSSSSSSKQIFERDDLDTPLAALVVAEQCHLKQTFKAACRGFLKVLAQRHASFLQVHHLEQLVPLLKQQNKCWDLFRPYLEGLLPPNILSSHNCDDNKERMEWLSNPLFPTLLKSRIDHAECIKTILVDLSAIEITSCGIRQAQGVYLRRGADYTLSGVTFDNHQRGTFIVCMVEETLDAWELAFVCEETGERTCLFTASDLAPLYEIPPRSGWHCSCPICSENNHHDGNNNDDDDDDYRDRDTCNDKDNKKRGKHCLSPLIEYRFD